MKKTTSFLLALLLMITLIPVAGLAENSNVDYANEVMFTIAGEQYSKEELTETIDRDSLFIPEEVAQEIALLFLEDTMQLPNVNWDSNTEIIAVVLMYDGSNTDTLSAYTFELTQGYVVVAAYLDAPNIILEWADMSEPVYTDLDLEAGDKVVYAGGLAYFKDDGTSELETIDGILVQRSKIIDILEENSDIENVPSMLLEDIVLYSQISDSSTSGISAMAGPGGVKIDDPYDHANQYYDGPFVYVNDVEGYYHGSMFDYNTTSSLNQLGNHDYPNNCVPTAITNIYLATMTRLWGWTIYDEDREDVYLDVINWGLDNKVYTKRDGTPPGSTFYYVKSALNSQYQSNLARFEYFDISTDYEDIANHLRGWGLLYIDIYYNDYYGDGHGLVGHGCIRLQSQSTGYFKSYIYVADGRRSGQPRYLDLAFIRNGDILGIHAYRP